MVRRVWLSGLLVVVLGVVGLGVGVSGASAALPWWHVTVGARPGNLPPEGEGELFVEAENVGDANVNGGSVPVRIGDVVPAGFEVTGMVATEPEPGGEIHKRVFFPCDVKTLTCTFTGVLVPFAVLEVRIRVKVREGAGPVEQDSASVSGGGAPQASVTRPVHVREAATPFGVEDYELSNELEGGAEDTLAGSHPFQNTLTVDLNQVEDSQSLSSPEVGANPVALTKDVSFNWPAGLIGNATAVPRCSIGQFLTFVPEEEDACPPQSAVGVAVLTLNEPGTLQTTLTIPVPLFNLEPAPGEPARFGFDVVIGNAPVVIDTSVRSGGDYGIKVSSDNITQNAAFVSAAVTVWGVPGAASHDGQRGWGCLYAAREVSFTHEPCNASEELHPPAFLTLPTSCSSELQSTAEGDSWTAPNHVVGLATYRMPRLDGCNRLPFDPEIKATPDGQQASTPTGLSVDVHVPQEGQLNATGQADSNIKGIAVTLPEGMILNPAAADGLQACPESLTGYTGARELEPELQPGVATLTFSPTLPSPLRQGVNFCPDASKVATVRIKSPLLPAGQPLEGAVYLASPQNLAGPPQENPFESLVAMYLVAEDPISGTVVKLAGKVNLNQETGRIETVFEGNPQLAFEDAEIHFFGGERAPLATPAQCGTYTTEATFTPWSGSPPVKSSSSFQITSGPGGTPCPGPTLPFTPTLASGSTNINAGAFSPLTTTLNREDGQQNIQSVQLHYPPGLAGLIASVPLCPEAQANAGTCGPESEIGETLVSVGVGGDPYTVTGGKVYLTEKYEGAPLGLSIVNPANAGPFHLGNVVVRAKIEIDERTAALTVTTGQIPHILDGFPLQIKHINVNISRPGFTFNPTSCNPQTIVSTISSVQGATASASTPFQIANCTNLAFTPKLAVSTAAHTSKANGASLHFKISYPNNAIGTQTWFSEAKFDLPKQLPARLTTLQKACPSATFEANPAGCSSAALIGHAIVHTPVLPVPLAGPVYFVSYGGAKFPDAVILLQGYGITIQLHGETFIRKGITSATFKSLPDVPFQNIEVTIPQGPYSEFSANLPATAHNSFCNQKLAMPTLFKAQNNQQIKQTTPITTIGCPKPHKTTKKHKPSKHKPSTTKTKH